MEKDCIQWRWGAADVNWGYSRAVEGILRRTPQSHHIYSGQEGELQDLDVSWLWWLRSLKQLNNSTVVKISSELLKALDVSGAVLADTSLQCCMGICDDALEVAGWGGGFTFQVLAQEVLNSLEISWVRCSGNMEFMVSCYRLLNLCIFQVKAWFVLLTVNQTHFQSGLDSVTDLFFPAKTFTPWTQISIRPQRRTSSCWPWKVMLGLWSMFVL